MQRMLANKIGKICNNFNRNAKPSIEETKTCSHHVSRGKKVVNDGLRFVELKMFDTKKKIESKSTCSKQRTTNDCWDGVDRPACRLLQTNDGMAKIVWSEIFDWVDERCGSQKSSLKRWQKERKKFNKKPKKNNFDEWSKQPARLKRFRAERVRMNFELNCKANCNANDGL